MSDPPLLPPRIIACRGSEESQRVFVGLVSSMSLFLHVTLSFVLLAIPAQARCIFQEAWPWDPLCPMEKYSHQGQSKEGTLPGRFPSPLLYSVSCRKRSWMSPKMAAILGVENSAMPKLQTYPWGFYSLGCRTCLPGLWWETQWGCVRVTH